MAIGTHYILDADHNVVPVSVLEWAAWFEQDENRRVALTYTHRYEISTVFLGLDHSWGDGPPIVFETMIFALDQGDDPFDLHNDMDRYATWDEARRGHTAMLERVANKEREAMRHD